MKSRPLAVTIIGWMFIVSGGVGLTYHLLPQHIGEQHSIGELVWVSLVRLAAVLGGGFMLYGFNWARWLLVAWIAYHVVLSAFHSVAEVAVHGVLFGVVVFFLFGPKS
jgi:hypothetical protein